MAVDTFFIVLFVAEIIFYSFHLSLLILLIAKRDTTFKGPFYSTFRIVIFADLLSFACTCIFQKISLFYVLKNFYKTNYYFGTIMSNIYSYTLVVIFFGHLIMAFNRFTLIWFPLYYQGFWKNPWYIFLLLFLPLLNNTWRFHEPATFVYLPNDNVNIVFENPVITALYFLTSTLIYFTATCMAAVVNVLSFIKFYFLKSTKINVNEKNLLFVSLITFIAQLLRTAYAAQQFFLRDNEFLTNIFITAFPILNDIFALSGSISFFVLSINQWKEMYAKILVSVVFFYVFVSIFYQYKTTIVHVNTKVLAKEEISSTGIPIYEKYISADYKYCGGLGNQLFHFVIYYGIGRDLNRTAFFYANKDCEVEAIKEMKSIFPNFYPYIKLLTPQNNETKFIDNMEDCCDYEKLIIVREKYLIFKDYVRHFYKFFNKYNNDIRYFLEFNKELKNNITLMAQNLFANDTSHKFCIHIRRGDFLSPTYKYQESQAQFIVPAINYIYKYLIKQGYSNISLVLMGSDDKFKHLLTINSTLFHQIYFPLITSRNEDLAFGARSCNTFLISATASSFAFWIAYLMPEGSNIFYNGKLYKKEKSDKFPFHLNFPSHWNKLNLG